MNTPLDSTTLSPSTAGGAGGARPLRVAAIADLHIHATTRQALRPMLTDIGAAADVLALCGDLTNLGLVEEAENLAADLAVLRIPIVAVLGNHDFHHGLAGEVKAILRRANVHFLDDETLELGDVGFAGVKGFGGGFGGHMLGAFGEDGIKRFVAEGVSESLALENALKSLATPRSVVVLHYAPVPDTVRGEPPEIFPWMGCSRLAETIDRFNVAAIVHGHAHHGSVEGRTPRGIPVYNCCMELLQRRLGRPYMMLEV